MDFKDCLKNRIAKEVSEDKELVVSLLKTSQNKLESADKLELSDVTSSSNFEEIKTKIETIF